MAESTLFAVQVSERPNLCDRVLAWGHGSIWMGDVSPDVTQLESLRFTWVSEIDGQVCRHCGKFLGEGGLALICDADSDAGVWCNTSCASAQAGSLTNLWARSEPLNLQESFALS